MKTSKDKAIKNFKAEVEQADSYMEEFRLRAKRTIFPEDPAAWADKVEKKLKGLIRKLPDKLKDDYAALVAVQIRDVRRNHNAGETETLQFSIMALQENLRRIQSNAAIKGAGEYQDHQANAGKARAEQRWSSEERETLDVLINRVKAKYREYADDRGVYTSADAWNELCGLMDEHGLSPREDWIKGDADKSTISYKGDNGKPLLYKTFKTRLSK